MNFISFAFSKASLLSVMLRVLLYCTPFTERMSNLPFLGSAFYSYDKLREAFFFFESGNNPYEIDHIFQKPLTAFLFYQIRSSRILTFAIFIVLDLLIAYLLEQDVFTKRNLDKEEENKANRPPWGRLYLFNPFTLYSCLTFSTQSLDYSLALASIFLMFSNRPLLSSTALGFAMYQNPRFACFLSVVLLASKIPDKRYAKTSSFDTLLIIQTIFTSGSVFGLLCYLSFLITNSWAFLETCYYRAFFLNYFETNLSLAWHLHTEMFIKYSDLYFATLSMFQFFIIQPLFLLFKKFLLAKHAQAGYIGLFTGLCLAIMVLLAPSSTFYEFALILILLCMQIEILNRIKFILIFNHVLMFGVCAAGYMTYSWKNGITVEPSWVFLQTAIFYGIYVAVISEILTSLKFEIVESKPVAAKIEPKQN